jgi:hypothetical protein
MADKPKITVLILEWTQNKAWMESKTAIVGERPSKLMALRGANALLAAAGLDVRLDELRHAHDA